MAIGNSKIKVLYILEILKKYSDEAHPLNSAEIIEKLLAYGVTCERKSLYNDIELLQIAGYDIINTKTPKSGYFLASREFEQPELSLLADAVMAANFVTPKKTGEILKKLEGFLSVHDAVNFRNRIFIDNTHKCENNEIYYNIDKIQRAIEGNKRVEFTYIRHKIIDGKPEEHKTTFYVSPYALTWVDDNYYLIGNMHKYNNLIHLRVDRMKGVTIQKKDARNFEEVSEYRGFFDTADYTAKAFNMFGGEKARIELLCKNESFEMVQDEFGKDIVYIKHDDNHFRILCDGIISEGLTSYLVQFADNIEVLSPPKLRRMVIDKIDRLCEVYKK